MKKVLITGADGFIGRNLRQHLAERGDVGVTVFTRTDGAKRLTELVRDADFIFHLAGVNRPEDPGDFKTGNADLSESLAQAIGHAARDGNTTGVVYASSIQAGLDNAYGVSKRLAEESLIALRELGVPVHIARLPNVFGKWCKPNYNSVVATFCHNIAHDLPITVARDDAPLTLVYIDDVIDTFLRLMDGAETAASSSGLVEVGPQYSTTVGALAAQISAFRASRNNLVTERVGTGLIRALYSTYVSYLPPEQFSYGVPQHADPRGVFVEFLKTADSGQFSFFTALPGITRGGHYHHSKTEKFLVIKGEALFKFRHVLSGATHELRTFGNDARIVETVPGWTHDITNVGTEDMIVMLWANEQFDRARADTYALAL